MLSIFLHMPTHPLRVHLYSTLFTLYLILVSLLNTYILQGISTYGAFCYIISLYFTEVSAPAMFFLNIFLYSNYTMTLAMYKSNSSYRNKKQKLQHIYRAYIQCWTHTPLLLHTCYCPLPWQSLQHSWFHDDLARHHSIQKEWDCYRLQQNPN